MIKASPPDRKWKKQHMTKAYLLEEMRMICGKIMGLLIEEDAQVKPDQLDIPADSDKFKMSFIRDGFNWLSEVFTTEYQEVIRIKKTQPEEIWLRYRSWGGFEDHEEVVLLRKAINELRAKVISRKRADYFKKSKRKLKSNKTKAGLKTEDTGTATK